MPAYAVVRDSAQLGMNSLTNLKQCLLSAQDVHGLANELHKGHLEMRQRTIRSET